MTSYYQQSFRTSDGLTLLGDVGGDARAPSVILLHGGGQTRHSWARTMQHLIERGYHVINYDARGHGDSDWSVDGNYSIEALTSDLLAIRQTVEGRVAFVGASMGGITGFHAVGSTTPSPAQALVLVDIVLQAAPAGIEKIMRFMSANSSGFATLDEAAAAVTAYNPDRPRPSDASGLMRNLRRRDDGRLYWHWDPRVINVKPGTEPLTQFDALRRVSGSVTVPTLVVRGEHSDIVDDQGIAEMRALVPQTEVHEVAGAGHMVAGDRNDAFSTGVVEFLARHFPA